MSEQRNDIEEYNPFNLLSEEKRNPPLDLGQSHKYQPLEQLNLFL